MNIIEFKNELENAKELHFEMPDGSLIPSYFHITEVGKITKHFIDCGGSIHTDQFANYYILLVCLKNYLAMMLWRLKLNIRTKL